MKLSPKEQAEEMWRIHTYYWNQHPLEARQNLSLQIAWIIRALEIYNVNDIEYWNQVKIEVYQNDKYNTD